MEEKDIMISMPLRMYEDYISARTRIEILTTMTIRNEFRIDRETVADVLGFGLPDREDG